MLGLLMEQKKQEDRLRGAEERSTELGRMAPSSLEPALGQSTQEKDQDNLRMKFSA